MASESAHRTPLSTSKAFHKQKFDFPMGSPLFPIVADIVRDDLETEYIASLPFYPPFYFRYVDDIITAVPSNEITTIKNIFNSYNHKFKPELELVSPRTWIPLNAQTKSQLKGRDTQGLLAVSC